jgi:hypothetical protein
MEPLIALPVILLLQPSADLTLKSRCIGLVFFLAFSVLAGLQTM